MTDILLLTYNRLHFLKQTIDALYERTRSPFRLIVVDSCSEDGTREYLKEDDRIGKVILFDEPKTICRAYDLGFDLVESKLFVMMQDDVIVPDLEPDWLAQLTALIKKHPDHGAVACRVQKIPNVRWTDGDLSPCSKALSAYCRIQRKADYKSMGKLEADRYWDDMQFVKKMRDTLGKKCSWANNLWCNHLGYMVPNKGYGERKRRWGWSEARMEVYLEKPYPEIDPKTNVPIRK